MQMLSAFTATGVADRVALCLFGLGLARTLDVPFTFVWAPGPGCRCRFEELFVARGFAVRDALERRPGRIVTAGTFSELSRALTDVPEDHVLLRGFFGHNFDAFDSVFAPSAEIAEAAARFRTDHFTADVIGIHVRRGDKVQFTIPDDGDYFAVVDRQLAHRPAARLFLGTDAADVEDSFRRRYGGRLLSYPIRTLSRDSPEGVIDAVTVLYLLRSTHIVVAGVYSGFSLLAAWNKPAAVVRKAASPISWDWEGRQILSPATVR